MAKQRTTTVTETEEEVLKSSADPFVVAARAFISDGEPLPDGLGEVEVSVKAQKMNKFQKPIQGKYYTTDKLREEMFPEIISLHGEGIYNFYVTVKRLESSSKPYFFTVKGVPVGGEENDDEEPVGSLSQAIAMPADNGNMVNIVLTMQQENMKLIMHQSQQTTQMMVALISAIAGKGGNGVGADAILKAVALGKDMAGGDSEGGEDEDFLESLAKQALPYVLQGLAQGGKLPEQTSEVKAQ